MSLINDRIVGQVYDQVRVFYIFAPAALALILRQQEKPDNGGALLLRAPQALLNQNGFII